MIARVCIYVGLDGRIAIIALRRPQPTFSIAKLREVDELVSRCTATSRVYRVLLKRSFRGCAVVQAERRRRSFPPARERERERRRAGRRRVRGYQRLTSRELIPRRVEFASRPTDVSRGPLSLRRFVKRYPRSVEVADTAGLNSDGRK